MRKQLGNWLSHTVAYTTTVNHATMVTTLLLICFYSAWVCIAMLTGNIPEASEIQI